VAPGSQPQLKQLDLPFPSNGPSRSARAQKMGRRPGGIDWLGVRLLGTRRSTEERGRAVPVPGSTSGLCSVLRRRGPLVGRSAWTLRVLLSRPLRPLSPVGPELTRRKGGVWARLALGSRRGRLGDEKGMEP
jgi:hypothetical protein